MTYTLSTRAPLGIIQVPTFSPVAALLTKQYYISTSVCQNFTLTRQTVQTLCLNIIFFHFQGHSDQETRTETSSNVDFKSLKRKVFAGSFFFFFFLNKAFCSVMFMKQRQVMS